MHSRLLVFNIETIPDRKLVPKSATGTVEPFPKPLHHQVIRLVLSPLKLLELEG